MISTFEHMNTAKNKRPQLIGDITAKLLGMLLKPAKALTSINPVKAKKAMQ